MSERSVLLVVDDDTELLALIAEIGERCGYSVLTADCANSFRQALAQTAPSLVILDLQMADMDGVEGLRHVAAVAPQAQVLLLSGLDTKVLASARQFGLSLGLHVLDAMQKPARLHDLHSLLMKSNGAPTPLTAADVSRAIAEHELLLHYQPLLHRVDYGWAIGSVEALVRWRHPERGLLHPQEFLPMVEREHLMAALTDFVLDTALRQVGHWHSRGLHLGLAVNLSASLVRDLHFPDRLSQVLREHGVEPAYLCLEVTEAASMGEQEVVLDSFARLRVHGIELALDDFGVGTSSLTQLYKMPYNIMKIDRVLIGEMAYSQQARTVVSALVDLGHKLGFGVCAEGVETESAFNLLERMGCDSMQGDFISPALSAADLEAFLDAWSAEHRPAAIGE